VSSGRLASALSGPLATWGDRQVVLPLLDAAGELGDRRAVPALLDLLAASFDLSLRSLINTILGRLGDPASAS
jgi:HEAT repeat protein